MKLRMLFVSLIIVTVFSCNTNQKEKDKKVVEIVKKDIENYVILNNSAGNFKVKSEMVFPKETENFKVDKKINTLTEEGTEYKEMEYTVSENSKTLMLLTADYNSETEETVKNISEIKVVSKQFKTLKGIGVGATIDEFISKYPNFKIWYTYIGDRYILDTEELKNVQFVLDKKDFTGKIEITGEIMLLKKSDFKPTTRVAQVRIF